MPNEVSNFCQDRLAVAHFLQMSARWEAIYHAGVQETNVSNGVLKGFLRAYQVSVICTLGPAGALLAAGAQYAHDKLTTVKEIDTGSPELDAAASSIYARYNREFLAFTDRGKSLQYLDSVRSNTHARMQALNSRFNEIREYNNRVTDALTSAYDWTHRVKVAADVGMIVVGTVVPLGWAANTAAGLAYTFTCRFANTMSEAGDADLTSYADPSGGGADLAGAAGNVAQDIGDNYVFKWARDEHARFLSECQRRAARNADRLAEALRRGAAESSDPIVQRMVKAGFNPSVSTPAVELARQEAALAQRVVTQYAPRMAPPAPGAPANGIQAMRAGSSKLGTAVAAGTRGAAIVVGLLFMKDDLIAAFEGKTAYERRKQMERAHRR